MKKFFTDFNKWIDEHVEIHIGRYAIETNNATIIFLIGIIYLLIKLIMWLV
jgi:hypothetical protein